MLGQFGFILVLAVVFGVILFFNLTCRHNYREEKLLTQVTFNPECVNSYRVVITYRKTCAKCGRTKIILKKVAAFNEREEANEFKVALDSNDVILEAENLINRK